MRSKRTPGVVRTAGGLVAAMVMGVLIATAPQLTESRAQREAAGGADPEVAAQLELARDLSAAFGHVAEEVSDAVVHVMARERVQRWDIFGRPLRPRERVGQGSGVIVSPEGYVVTNHHVVKDATEPPLVTLADGREYEARIVGLDPLHDLALLKVDATSLPAAEFGDSDDVRVGEWVLAIGSPFGFQRTVTAGIVSATHRAGVGLAGRQFEETEEFIQTDAAINPGNSGGPLVDLNGKVIGINSAIASRGGGSVGIGFAIPSELVQAVMENLIRSGRVELGWLGVVLTPAPEGGVRVREVVEGGPADRAGLRAGDVIRRYRGRAYEDVEKLIRAIQYTPPGTRADVLVERGGEGVSVEVPVGDPVEEQARLLGGVRVPALGVVAAPLSEEVERMLGVERPRIGGGVVLIDVEPGSSAESAGFRKGDVIVRVEEIAVDDPGDLREVMVRYARVRPVRFYVQRGDVTGYIDLVE